MRLHQTAEHVRAMREHFAETRRVMDVWTAFELLDQFVDASDPDTDEPNSVHMYQTAENLRAEGAPEWLQGGWLHCVFFVVLCGLCLCQYVHVY